jgi:hypothetical protein
MVETMATIAAIDISPCDSDAGGILAVRPRDAAKMLSIGITKMKEMLAANEIKHIKIGGVTLICLVP